MTNIEMPVRSQFLVFSSSFLCYNTARKNLRRRPSSWPKEGSKWKLNVNF